MKRILVTGASGYIGRAFFRYIGRCGYRADAVSLRGEAWKSVDFSPYDVIVHTVGLAHVKETKENGPLYDQVNRDLAVETARKARAEGVGQFVFLSSLSVYGIEEGVLTPDTVPDPKSRYGRSKLEAERLLAALETESFRVAVLRPPMVYGPNCPGNYRVLVRLAKVLPVCPDYENRRSAVSIETLCAEIKRMIDQGSGGFFVPQDSEYFCTCRAIQRIAEEQGRHLPVTKLLNFGPELLRRFTAAGKKAFGDLVYRDESQCGDAGVQR